MRDGVKSLLGAVALLAILGTLIFVVFKGRLQSTQEEYEGTVVEKWAAYSHTEEGSFPNYRLLVEKDNGQKLHVTVTYETYQAAQTGGRIKKTKTGIELAPGKSSPPP